jgi:purine-binding chemotaxis protein CheW
MKGVLNLRGDVIPLIDARLKLGVKAMDYNQNTSILILELEQNKEQIRVGIIVDAVQEVFEMRDDKILAPPSIGNSYAYSYISGVVELNGVFAMILEMDKLFWYNQGESDLENKFSA